MTRLPAQDLIDLQILHNIDGVWKLMGSRCPACSRFYYPPHSLCGDDLSPCETTPLSEEGVLYAAARVEIAPEGFRSPYWVGYVDLPEGVRVFAQLRWTQDGAPQIGATMRFGTEVLREGTETIGPVFTGPIDGHP